MIALFFFQLSFSPTTPVWNHVKLLLLLGSIFILCGFMLLVSVFVGFFGGFNTFAFLSAEVRIYNIIAHKVVVVVVVITIYCVDLLHTVVNYKIIIVQIINST